MSTTSEQPCPDPSAHHKHNKLSEQASTAALYATHPEKNREVLNPDGKLSSRSAAASLKYAQPQDLPSFPTHGIDTANSAGQAAMLAKDYRMKELWQPEMSAAGSKAALLAHKDGGKLDLWHPSASADGNSAAKLAMQNKTLSPTLDYGYTKDGRSNALLAATKSQRDGRQRAGSTPVVAAPLYPDSANSAHNALNAATISHRAASKPHTGMEPDGWDSAAMQAARVQNIGDHVDRAMYTEKPPVEIELREKRDKDALRASAVSMAKQMYDVQNRTVLGEKSSLDPKSLQSISTGTKPVDMKAEAMKYIHLQDAAHKLAQERLAKVDKNFEQMRYREYYGYNTNPPRSRLSMGGLMRKRASSDTAKDELDSDDEEQARRVRTQMSQFNSALANVNAKKQQTDRDALLAVAQKRVQQSMLDMDAKVFQDTGKVSQAMMDEWEVKAKRRATEDGEKREVNRGKTHIGAGKYMDTSEIEAIARARLQPTLDEVDANAARMRARDEEIRHEKAEQERMKQLEKQRDREGKEEWKRFKEVEKATAKKEKEERKAAAADKEDTEKHRSFLSRLSVRRKSRETNKHEAEHVGETSLAGATLAEVADKVKEENSTPAPATTDIHTKPATKPESSLPLAAVGGHEAIDTDVSSALEPTTKPETDDDHQKKGIKGLFSKLKNRRSPTDEDNTAVVGSAAVADEQHEKAMAPSTPVIASTVTEPPTLPQHMGTDGQIGDSQHVSGLQASSAASPSSFRRRDAEGNDADISSLSSGVDEDDFKEGRTGRAARALGMKKNAIEEPVTSSSKLDDDEEEQTFEEAPETSFTGQQTAVAHGRETKFQEVL